VKLKKALYGCRQSGRLWYNKISKILSSIGFTKSRFDECVFTL
jgi:ribosomal protein L37E